MRSANKLHNIYKYKIGARLFFFPFVHFQRHYQQHYQHTTNETQPLTSAATVHGWSMRGKKRHQK